MVEENTTTTPTSDGTEQNTAATEGSNGTTQAGAETEAKDFVTLSKAELQGRIDSAIATRLAQERRTKQKEDERKVLPEVERLKAELKDKEDENLRYRAKEDFLTKAREAKLDNALKVYELYAHRLQFGNKGECLNLEAVLTQAKADIAELTRGLGTSREKSDASARSTGPGATSNDHMNQVIRQQIR